MLLTGISRFDCFILTGPSTFTVDAWTNDTDVSCMLNFDVGSRG